jgi:hypothetical protein
MVGGNISDEVETVTRTLGLICGLESWDYASIRLKFEEKYSYLFEQGDFRLIVCTASEIFENSGAAGK